MNIEKDDVLAQLAPEKAAAAYGLDGRWYGRWMRSKRCPQTTHGTDAFAISREGKWHCHGCDIGGGDVLSLIAACEGLDASTGFQEILEIGASLAGIEPEADFGDTAKPLRAPTKRPMAPALPALSQRLTEAYARCEWVWSHLKVPARVLETGRHWYLETRGLRWSEIPDDARINVRDLGFWTVPGDFDQLIKITGESEIPKEKRRIARTIHSIYSTAVGVAVAVRHVETGRLCDVRARRAEPKEGEPKILGMAGGVTVDARAGVTDLIACYGMPHSMQRETVVVVEGWADYLTAALRWQKADVLGAVDAGQYPLVAGFAARYLAERGAGRLVLVAQDDPIKEVTNPKTGEVTTMPGAAERAVDAASKRAIALLGPADVSWIEMRQFGAKDLNVLAQAGRLGELPEVTT